MGSNHHGFFALYSSRSGSKRVRRHDLLHKCHGDLLCIVAVSCGQQWMLLRTCLVPSLRSEEVVLTNLEDPVWPWAIKVNNLQAGPSRVDRPQEPVQCTCS